MQRKSRYPARVGAIDIGSNALRFVAAEITGPGRHAAIESGRFALRLGQDVFRTGRLQPETIEKAVEGLGGFLGRLSALEVTNCRSVATSAVRRSANSTEFVQRVRNELGLAIEIIDAAEEARLVFLAVKDRLLLEEGRWLLVDLGGGSAEISLIIDGSMSWTESRPVGAVRLLEELGEQDAGKEKLYSIVSDYISSFHFPPDFKSHRIAGFIAIGGNIESLAKLAGAPECRPGVVALGLDELRSVEAKLRGLSYAARVTDLGLSEDRADVIVPAAAVYGRLAEVADAGEILVPFVGVKEGLIQDLTLRVGG